MSINKITGIMIIVTSILLSSVALSPAASDINVLIAGCQANANNANDEALKVSKQETQTAQQKQELAGLRKRLNALRKSLAEVKRDDPTAEKRVRDIDAQLTTIRNSIRALKH